MLRSVLLASGAPPALSSASVHAAEVVTTGLAGASHVWHQNVEWRTFRRLAVAGVIGGVTGAYVLTELPEKPVKVFVTVYLFGMALLILHRIIRGGGERKLVRGTVPIGVVGGVLCSARG